MSPSPTMPTQDATLPPIDGPLFDPDRLTVRGRDLNDLVGNLSFVAALYHLLTGHLPTPSQVDALDQWLCATLRSLTPDHPLAQMAQQSAALGANEIGALLAALALGDGLGLPATLDTTPLDALGLRAYAEGLYYFALAPLLHAYALETRRAAGNAGDSAATMAARLAQLADSSSDFVGAIFGVVTGKKLVNVADRALFDATLVAFHAGLGTHAPTLALPRGASATRASTAIALAAGYSATGPAHVGACKVVMGYFQELVESAPSLELGALAVHARTSLDALLAAGGRVVGMGHPLFRQDPRNPHLRDLVKAQGTESQGGGSPYLVVYDTIAARMHEQRSLHPNIDAIAAAIFLTLGISPAYGTALFLCARMAAMVAHIEDARPKSKLAR